LNPDADEPAVTTATAPTDTAPAAEPAPPAPAAPAPTLKHTALAANTQTQAQLIREISKECGLALEGAADHTERALMLARGMNQLREAFNDAIMGDVMALCGSALGFTTDRDKGSKSGPYKREEIKEAVIEATLRGAYLTGNEFTIISGRPHLTKEHWQRRVREIPGLTDLELKVGVPSFKGDAGGSALVPVVATWKCDGMAYRLECVAKKDSSGNVSDDRIPCRVNSGQGADQVMGKAEAKACRRIYRRMTGSTLGEAADDGDERTIDVTSRPAAAGEDSAIAAERAAANQAHAADDESQDGGGTGFDYSDFLTEFESKLSLALDSDRPVVACGQARAWALQPPCDLPKEVIRQVNELHDAFVKTARERKHAPASPGPQQGGAK